MESNITSMLNMHNIMRYIIMFAVVSISTKMIPTCQVLQNHAIYVGLIGSSTLALLDMCFPNYVLDNKEKYHSL